MIRRACHLCGSEEVDHFDDFCVQVKAIGVDTGGSAHNWINLRGRACAGCHAELKRFHRKRLGLGLAVLAVAFIGWFPLWIALESVLGRLTMLVSFLVAAIPAVIAFWWILNVEKGFIERLHDAADIEMLSDIMPDAGGILRWRAVRIFPAIPTGQSSVNLDEVGSLVGTRKGGDEIEDRLERIRRWKKKYKGDA